MKKIFKKTIKEILFWVSYCELSVGCEEQTHGQLLKRKKAANNTKNLESIVREDLLICMGYVQDPGDGLPDPRKRGAPVSRKGISYNGFEMAAYRQTRSDLLKISHSFSRIGKSDLIWRKCSDINRMS